MNKCSAGDAEIGDSKQGQTIRVKDRWFAMDLLTTFSVTIHRTFMYVLDVAEICCPDMKRTLQTVCLMRD